MVTLNNKLDQMVVVSYHDSDGDYLTYNLPAKGTVVLATDTDHLTVETKRLITLGILTTDSAQPTSPPPPTSPMSPVGYANDWAVGVHYSAGLIVLYLGNFYIVIVSHTAVAGETPDVTPQYYQKFSSGAADFGVAISVDQLPIKTLSGWKSSLINDENVNTLSQNKITGLLTALSTLLLKAGDTMTGPLVLSADPSAALQAATKQYTDQKLSKAGGTMTGPLVLSGAPTANLHASTKLYVDNAVGARVAKTGDTMSGPLVLSGAPVTGLGAATKDYVDSAVGNVATGFLPLSGGTMTGVLVLSGAPTSNLHAATKAYVDTAVNLRLSKSGGTMTGFIVLSGDPTSALHAATKQYVDTAANLKLNLAGGTMTGLLTLSGAPTSNLHAATKLYVDSALSSTYVPLGGGTMTGILTLSADPSSALHAATKQYVDVHANKVLKAGDTMTGLLTLSGAPTSNLHAATKLYVDSAVAARLALSGGTLTGALTLSGAPTSGLHATTKTYVDAILPANATYQEMLDGLLAAPRLMTPLQISQAINSPNRNYRGWITIGGVFGVDGDGNFTLENTANTNHRIPIGAIDWAVEPVVSSPPGGAYEVGRQITLTCLTQRALIAVTIDGSDPRTPGNPNAYLYTPGDFYLTQTSPVTVKAAAQVLNGLIWGPVTTWVFNPNPDAPATPTIPDPFFDPTGGNYTRSGGTLSVVIADDYPGASIRYTTDGVTTPSTTVGTLVSPANGSTPPSATITIGTASVGGTVTVKAISYKAGANNSNVISQTYTISLPSSPPPSGGGSLGGGGRGNLP